MIDIQIPFHELDFTNVRSRGPGGQNVNKTNSAVILRWNLYATQAFSEEAKYRLTQKLQSRLTEDGDLLIRSEVHRDQNQNRSECIRKLQEVLQKTLFIPKKRIATKPTKSSQRKRLTEKKTHSEKKSLRQKVRD